MRLDDGHATLIEFDLAPSVMFWEKEVTPPGMSAGGANDTTTMRNQVVRTKAPKKLKSMDDAAGVMSYDPSVYDDVWDDLIGKNGLITITFSDNSQLSFWGWLDEFKPNSCKEGEQPTANIKIICSNQDDSQAEVGPSYAAA